MTDQNDFRYSCETLSGTLHSTVACTSLLPTRSKGLALYRSHGTFSALLDAQCDRILALVQNVYKGRGVRGHGFTLGGEKVTLGGQEELNERVQKVATANDVLLDRAGSHLDRAEMEVRGKKLPPKPAAMPGGLSTLGKGGRTVPQWVAAEPWDAENSPPAMVETEENLKNLVETLKNVDMFAVDLEHNEYRSYLGLTCLIQISTKDQDFIIDPFPIWKHVHLLNEVFSNSEIIKVLHGCDRDVRWLQRDFNVYLTPPLFDTGRAARHLNFAKSSLDYVVSKIYPKCPPMNKSLALADWRQRPLQKELINYARSDTHYLLYCYVKMRNMLLEQGGKSVLESVWMTGVRLCAQLYEKPVFNAYEECDKILSRTVYQKRRLNSQQLYALKKLLSWRDATARTTDESTSYTLPTHMLLQMASVLPRDPAGLLACCAPVPREVRRQIGVVHACVAEALSQPLAESDSTRLCQVDPLGTTGGSMPMLGPEGNVLDTLMAPHDQSHTKATEEWRGINSLNRDTMTASVSGVTPFIGVLRCLQSRSTLNAMDGNGKVAHLAPSIKSAPPIAGDFLSPFDKYQLAVYDREKKEEMERAKNAKSDKSAAPVKKARFTHIDSSTGVGEKPTSYPSTSAKKPLDSSKSTPEATTFDDSELRPRAKLRKSEKLAKESADIRTFDYKSADRRVLDQDANSTADGNGKHGVKRKSVEGNNSNVDGAKQKKRKMRGGRSQLVSKGSKSITYK